MKENEVTNQTVLDLTFSDSSLRAEKEQNQMPKNLSFVRRHSFTEVGKSSDFSKINISLNQYNQKNVIPISNPKNSHQTKSSSETNLSLVPNKSIYSINMPNTCYGSILSKDSCYTGEISSFASVTTMGEAASLDSGVGDLPGAPPECKSEEKQQIHNVIHEETATAITIQVLIPYLIAGLGTCGAGLVLDTLQQWIVFRNITELFVVVTPLLGLKGNLEMTLASRLSTQAHLGHLRTFKEVWTQGWGNMVLKLAQASVMGVIAAIFAVVSNVANFNYEHALLLSCSCLGTACITTVGLGTVTTTVVAISHHYNINPDNIATPIAASLGDVTTLGVLALIAAKLYEIKGLIEIPATVIGILLALVPFWIYCAKKNIYVHRLILTGWLPIILAVFITSGGGFILEKALKNFEGMAVFQPVINGLGGNLVAVQSSRIASYFHQRAKLGKLPSSSKELCVSPCYTFFGKNDHSRTARILMLLVLPGHLIFAYIIHGIKGGNTSLSLTFTPIYLVAALLQVAILLYIAHNMIHWMWRLKIDPDNSAIPFMTALGDLFGTGLLALAFLIHQQLVPPDVITLSTLPSNTTYSPQSFPVVNQTRFL